MSDIEFLQAQTIALGQLTKLAGNNPILGPQLQQRLVDVARDLATAQKTMPKQVEENSSRPVWTLDSDLRIRQLIEGGETESVAFARTARQSVSAERAITRSIAAFLNSHGGTLFIGITDDGSIAGLSEEYGLSGNAGRASYHSWLMGKITKELGTDVGDLVSISFLANANADTSNPGAGDVCVVEVKESPTPRFVVEDGQERFYVGTGSAPYQLKPSEMIAYSRQHWSDFAKAS